MEEQSMHLLRRRRHERELEAIGGWVQRRIIDGDLPYFLTFQFRPLRGNHIAVIAQMQDEIVRCYATTLRCAYRHPAKLSVLQLPLLVCAPDLPVWKREAERRLRDFTANDGLHYHAIALFPRILACAIT